MPSRAALAAGCEARALTVHDGDTLTVRCGDRVPQRLRLARMDAPEYRQPAGREARAALVALVGGRALEIHTLAVDRYGRTVAEVRVDGQDLGEMMVGAGWAWCGRRPRADCRRLEQEARAGRRGLWAIADPVAPWDWRRDHPGAP